MNIRFDIFSTEYLQFIFSNLWTFLGFVIILLIITNKIGKPFEWIKIFIARIKTRYERIKIENQIQEKIKKTIPRGLKEDEL